MPNWILSEDDYGNFEMLSSLGEIINIPESPLSLRKTGLHAVTSLIKASACPNCSIIFLKAHLPATINDEIMRENPGDSLVSCYYYNAQYTAHPCVQYNCTVQ